jgi:tetratricopeptide (TPR) repeat protein
MAVIAALVAEAPSAPAQTAPPAVLPADQNVEVQRVLREAFERAGDFGKAEAADKRAVTVAGHIEASAERGELGRAWYLLASYYLRRGRVADALAEAQGALQAYEDRAPASHDMIVAVHGTIGLLANRAHDYVTAEAHLRWVVEAYARDPRRTSAKEAGTANLNLSTSLRQLGRVAEAEASLHRAIAIREKDVPRDGTLVAGAWWWLATFLAEQNRGAAAEAAFATAVAAAEPASEMMLDVLIAQTNWHHRHGKPAVARAGAEKAAALASQRYGAFHPKSLEARVLLGHVTMRQGDRKTAEDAYRSVVGSYAERPTRENAPWAAGAGFELALSLRITGRSAEAERPILTAIAARETHLADDTANLALCWQVLGFVQEDLRKHAAAAGSFRKSIGFYRAAGKADAAGHAFYGLGSVLFESGQYREAEEPLLRSIELHERAGDGLAGAFSRMRLATAYRYLGRLEESEAAARQVLALREAKLPPDDPAIGEAVFGLAAALRWQGKDAEAEPFYRRSRVIREKAFGPDNQHVLADRYGLALAIDGMGRAVEAEGLLRQLLADQQRALGPVNVDVANTFVSLAWNLRRQGRFADAVPFAEQPLAIFQQVLGMEHPTTVSGLLMLAAVRLDRAEYDAAERLYNGALRIRLKVYGADSSNVADSYGDLMRLSIARRQFEQAEGWSARRLAILEARFGADDPRLLTSLADLQCLKAWNGDLEAVDGFARRILGIAERAYGPESLQAAVAASNVAHAYRLRGKFGNIERFYERPLAIYRKLLGPKHPWVADALMLLAAMRVSLHQPDEALSLLDEATGLLVERFGEASPVLSRPLTDKALLLIQLNRMEEAESLLRRAAELLRQGSGKPTSPLAVVLVNLSIVLQATGRRVEASKLQQEAVDIWSTLFGPNRLPPLELAPLLPLAPREI